MSSSRDDGSSSFEVVGPPAPRPRPRPPTKSLRMRAESPPRPRPRRAPAPAAAAPAGARRSRRLAEQAAARSPPAFVQICRPPDVVMATGDWPNGHTVVGFVAAGAAGNLQPNYICTCHGSSFTSVEFLLHAGATDVSRPEEKIATYPWLGGAGGGQ